MFFRLELSEVEVLLERLDDRLGTQCLWRDMVRVPNVEA
jgi:hypothetical protein